jgi:hypothetical protein
MRVQGDTTEDAMIRAFVEAEIDSPIDGPRYTAVVGGDVQALLDPAASALRAQALRAVRGYPDAYLFTGFPRDVSWKLVAVSVDELGDFLYLNNEPGWSKLSRGSRLVRDGAANVETPVGVDKAASILGVEQAVRDGQTFPPIIAVALDESSPRVIVEGHTRATAYVRAPKPDDEVEAITGYSPSLARWHFF